MNKNNYDILITGGGGFLGVAICEYLLKQSMRVVCLDTTFDHQRLESLDKKPDVIVGSVLDEKLIEDLISRSAKVIHLAAVVGVDHYINQPLAVLDVNILGTRNIFRCCLKYNRPVIFSSTSEVYGKNKELLHEDSDVIYGKTTNKRWCYAITKATSEHYAHAMKGEGLNYLIIRYFNIYGPLMDKPGEGRVISKFLGAIHDKKPLILVDGGEAVRSFCYIDEAAEATALLALNLKPDSPYNHEVINIGRSEPNTIKEVADIIIRLSGHKYGSENIPGDTFFGKGFEEIPYRVPNTNKLKEILGFTAVIDLKEGLRRTLKHWNMYNEDSDIDNDQHSLVPFVRPYLPNTKELLNQYGDILSSGYVTNNGPYLQKFEKELGNYLDKKDVAVLSNASDALFLALNTLDLKGKVVLPSYTFAATLNAILQNGLEPIFCDINPDTFTISISALQDILVTNSDISCVMPVNVFGVPPELNKIAELSDKFNFKIVYDNAHGFGTTDNGPCKDITPDFEIYSFHATKTMPAIEGGAITSVDPELLLQIRRGRNHGIHENLIESSPSINSKMDELRAATGIQVLYNINKHLECRRNYGDRIRDYMKNYSDIFSLQKIPENIRTNYQNLAVLCSSAETIGLQKIIDLFKEHKIEVRSYFNPPLHLLNIFNNRYELQVTEKVHKSLICFPLHSYMSEGTLNQIETAIHNVAEFCRDNSTLEVNR